MSWESRRYSHGYAQAIIHVDADAFFASVEQAVHPEYRGKPLVTGVERGIISAASYEAKLLGIRRGISLYEAKRICPELIMVPTDYETCSRYSERIFAIMRRFTPTVEENSIDEGFADVTGLSQAHRCSYPEIAKHMKKMIEQELGISVSVGLSLSKTLAKLCSDWNKPSGCVSIPGRERESFLKEIPVGAVWGIGKFSQELLKKRAVYTAYDFVQAGEKKVRDWLGKLGVEKYHELNGKVIYPVNPQAKRSYQSISKFKTFTPPTGNRETIRAYLLRNLESACIKARRYDLAPKEIFISLRTQKYASLSVGAKLTRATSAPQEIIPLVNQLFSTIFRKETFRATGVVLSSLSSVHQQQLGLFDEPVRIEKLEKISDVIDDMNQRFGKHTVHVATTLAANQQHQGGRGELSWRKQNLFAGETFRQRLGVPLLAYAV